MKRLFPLLRVVLFLAFWTCLDASADRQVPPVGFVWQDLDAVGGAVLRPSNWFCREIVVKNGVGYLISEEDIYAQDDYVTGMKIKYTQLDEGQKLSASDIARKIYRARQNKGPVSELILGSQSGFSTITFYHDEPVSSGSSLVTHHFVNYLMTNNKARLLIYITFDCPLDLWPEKQRLAQVMLSKMTLVSRSEKEDNQALVPTPMPVTPPAGQETRQPQARHTY